MAADGDGDGEDDGDDEDDGEDDGNDEGDNDDDGNDDGNDIYICVKYIPMCANDGQLIDITNKTVQMA